MLFLVAMGANIVNHEKVALHTRHSGMLMWPYAEVGREGSLTRCVHTCYQRKCALLLYVSHMK